jgi:hypothetical protein
MKPYVANFEAQYANLGASWPFQGPLNGPWELGFPDQSYQIYVCGKNVYYLFQTF